MAVRPNVQSPLVIVGNDLKVQGESTNPLPTAIYVVVTQADASGRGAVEVAQGVADRAATGWNAVLSAQGFNPGPAQSLGIEIRVAPFEVRSWVQSVTIQ
jgi:hypothetical protein